MWRPSFGAVVLISGAALFCILFLLEDSSNEHDYTGTLPISHSPSAIVNSRATTRGMANRFKTNELEPDGALSDPEPIQQQLGNSDSASTPSTTETIPTIGSELPSCSTFPVNVDCSLADINPKPGYLDQIQSEFLNRPECSFSINGDYKVFSVPIEDIPSSPKAYLVLGGALPNENARVLAEATIEIFKNIYGANNVFVAFGLMALNGLDGDLVMPKGAHYMVALPGDTGMYEISGIQAVLMHPTRFQVGQFKSVEELVIMNDSAYGPVVKRDQWKNWVDEGKFFDFWFQSYWPGCCPQNYVWVVNPPGFDATFRYFSAMEFHCGKFGSMYWAEARMDKFLSGVGLKCGTIINKSLSSTGGQWAHIGMPFIKIKQLYEFGKSIDEWRQYNQEKASASQELSPRHILPCHV